MKYTCITSMTAGHIEHIGKIMHKSWMRYWPDDCELIVYAENFSKESEDSRVKFISWEDNCLKEWETFCTRTDDNNTRRFAKKGFSFLHAMENKNTNKRLAWLDADLLFKKPINKELLDKILPNNKLIALFDCYYQLNRDYTQEQYVDWKERKTFGAESGFVVINTDHKLFETYVKNYRKLFTSDKDSSLVNWYDGEVVLSAAKEFLVEVEDLSKHRTTNKTQTPLNHSYLADYMGHIKAKRKKHMTIDQFKEIANLN
jgi:hypothetical protein